jgi:hypothetical protein
MRRAEHPKVKALEWYLELINSHLEDESEEEIYKRLFDVSMRFDWTPAGAEPYNLPGPQDLRRLYPIKKARTGLKGLQASLRSLLEDAISSKRASLGKYNLTLYRGNVSLKWEVETRVLPRKASRPKVAWMPAARAMLAYTLAGLPDGLPPNPIRRCTECGAYYLATSRKPREFCSPKCTSIHISRRKRGEPGSTTRREYNREMSYLMREKYRAKAPGPDRK